MARVSGRILTEFVGRTRTNWICSTKAGVMNDVPVSWRDDDPQDLSGSMFIDSLWRPISRLPHLMNQSSKIVPAVRVIGVRGLYAALSAAQPESMKPSALRLTA